MHARLRDLSPGVRRELLLVLSSPSNVRADVIRQFYERGKAELADVLIDLEADPVLRVEVVAALREAGAEGSP